MKNLKTVTDIWKQIHYCDLVIGVQYCQETESYKFFTLKDREGENDEYIDFSGMMLKLARYATNSYRISKIFQDALTPIIEKIKLYETFE